MNASRSVTLFTSLTTSDNRRDKHPKGPFVHVIHGPAAPAHKAPKRSSGATRCSLAIDGKQTVSTIRGRRRISEAAGFVALADSSEICEPTFRLRRVVEALFRSGSISRRARFVTATSLVIGATRAPALIDGILAVDKRGQMTGGRRGLA